MWSDFEDTYAGHGRVEDNCRVRTDHGAENLAIIRKIAINLIKKHDTSQISLKKKLFRCNWDLDYLKSLIY